MIHYTMLFAIAKSITVSLWFMKIQKKNSKFCSLPVLLRDHRYVVTIWIFYTLEIIIKVNIDRFIYLCIIAC